MSSAVAPAAESLLPSGEDRPPPVPARIEAPPSEPAAAATALSSEPSSAPIATEVAPTEDVSHQVNAAGTHPKGVLRWGYFLVLNGIAGVIAVSMFVGLIYADGIDPYLRGTYDWLLAHPGVTSFIAFSPLASSLLVGWGYSQRARKRKAAAARAAELASAAAATDTTAEPATESPSVAA
jgi:hypothetical protein